MMEFVKVLLLGFGRIHRSLGKPFRPEDRLHSLSLFVDWLPALFADPVEYLRLRACIYKDGRRMCRVGETSA